MLEIIEKLESASKSHKDIDDCYSLFRDTVFGEMNQHLQFKQLRLGKQSSKKYKTSKPYWDEDLKQAWLSMSKSEKVFLSPKGTRINRRKLREDFKTFQLVCDKLLRNKKKSFNR